MAANSQQQDQIYETKLDQLVASEERWQDVCIAHIPQAWQSSLLHPARKLSLTSDRVQTAKDIDEDTGHRLACARNQGFADPANVHLEDREKLHICLQ